jgi:hypothetical protein
MQVTFHVAQSAARNLAADKLQKVCWRWLLLVSTGLLSSLLQDNTERLS